MWQSGGASITAKSPGFKQLVSQINYDGSRPTPFNFALSIGSVSETAMVTTEAGRNTLNFEIIQRNAKKNAEKQQMAASSNVFNLQQRISGVLPVRVDVPRAGNSYNVVTPLGLDEETKVTFTYKSK